MPRMNKQRRLEWSFFLAHRNRISYNPLCRGCVHGCKQSFRAFARITGQNAGNRPTEGCHDSLYIIMQLIAVVATVIFSSQMMSGSHSYGKDYAMLVMSAVVIGGTSIAGGAGNMLGTLKGLLFLGLVLNAMTIANLGEYVQYIVRGGLIIFAIILNMTQQSLQTKVQARETEKHMQHNVETSVKE